MRTGPNLYEDQFSQFIRREAEDGEGVCVCVRLRERERGGRVKPYTCDLAAQTVFALTFTICFNDGLSCCYLIIESLSDQITM